MKSFSSKEQAVDTFKELFEVLINDEVANKKMREAGIDARIVHVKPDFEIYISPDGVLLNSGKKNAVISIRMSCDTANSLWLGKLVMPIALATGKVKIKGSIPKVLEFLPVLEPAFNKYSEIYKKNLKVKL